MICFIQRYEVQIGPQTVEQLESSLEAADLELTKEEREYLLNDM